MYETLLKTIFKPALYFYVKGQNRMLDKLNMNHLKNNHAMSKSHMVNDFLDEFKVDEDVISKQTALRNLKEADEVFKDGFKVDNILKFLNK